jgi:hypothetical protein
MLSPSQLLLSSLWVPQVLKGLKPQSFYPLYFRGQPSLGCMTSVSIEFLLFFFPNDTMLNFFLLGRIFRMSAAPEKDNCIKNANIFGIRVQIEKFFLSVF